MNEYILKPSGINKQVFTTLIKRRNVEGKLLTKREIAMESLVLLSDHEMKKLKRPDAIRK